jgi:hypothetical protein
LSSEREAGAQAQAAAEHRAAEQRRARLRRQQAEERGQLRGGRDLVAAKQAKVEATLQV